MKKGQYHLDTATQARARLGSIAGGAGILLNGLLFGGKLLTGLRFGSVSVRADAVNNLTDMLSSLIVLVGFRLSARPADKEHPYGHGRYEYLTGLAVAALILTLGVRQMGEAVGRILHPAPALLDAGGLILLVIAIGVKGWMYVGYRLLGQKIASGALMAAAADSRNDMLTTAAVLLAGLAERWFSLQADGYMGALVSALILLSGGTILRYNVSILLGRQADPELEEKLRTMALSDGEIRSVHKLLVHDYGPGQRFASMHVRMDPDANVKYCHQMIDRVEKRAQRELGVQLLIHCEPDKTDT